MIDEFQKLIIKKNQFSTMKIFSKTQKISDFANQNGIEELNILKNPITGNLICVDNLGRTYRLDDNVKILSDDLLVSWFDPDDKEPSWMIHRLSLNEMYSKYEINTKEIRINDIKILKKNNIFINSFEITEDFRNKFPANLRTNDGHMVRSRAELLIDNALYDYKLAHAYEKKLPIKENLYCDFYIPTGNVYIEFWGLENDLNNPDKKSSKEGSKRSRIIS